MQRVRTFKGSERDGTKTNSERDVDLLPQAMEALKVIQPYTFMQKIERKNTTDTASDIFQNPLTQLPWHDHISQRKTYWKPTLKRLGIRWRRPYTTRHSFATAGLMTGVVTPGYLASQLGHSVLMLLSTYTRWIPANNKGGSKTRLAKAFEENSSLIRKN